MRTPTDERAPDIRRNAAAAVVLAASQTVVAMVLYAALIRLVGAEAVGLWVVLMAAATLACTADLALNLALVRAVPQAALEGGPQRQAIVVQTLVLSATVLTGVALLVLWATLPWWVQWLDLSAAQRAQTHSLMPWLVAGAWFNRIADLLSGCLEGLQRFVVRSAIGVGSAVVGLLLAVALAWQWGIAGAAAAFCVQYLLQAAVSAVWLRRLMPQLRWLTARWHWPVFVEGARYGLSLQGLVLCYALLENGTKLMLARGGFVAQVPYFDLAFRIGKGVRGLLASALRVLVPRLVAERHLSGRQEQIYATSFGFVVAVAAPLYAGLLAGAHELSWLLIGHDEPAFVDAVALVLFPWLAYCLTDPALNTAMASGRMRAALLSHLVTVVVVFALLRLPGAGGNARWLFAAVAGGMLAGTAALLVASHGRAGLPWRLTDPPRSLAIVAGAIVVGLFGVRAPELLAGHGAALRWLSVGCVAALFALGVWCSHPVTAPAIARGWSRLAGRLRAASQG